MDGNRMFTPADLIFEEKSREELTEALEGFKDEIIEVIEKNPDKILSLNDRLNLLRINPFILNLYIEKERIYFDPQTKEWKDQNDNIVSTDDMVNNYLEYADKAVNM